jgi:hypothetical protein
MRESGQIVNRSGFIRAGMKESLFRSGTGITSEDEVRGRTKDSLAVMG